jgi:nitroimidazol reductase NimA-like FMN-containing flavoprotein (pyridoxamine 5'-phosphate oxidase superfamily)
MFSPYQGNGTVGDMSQSPATIAPAPSLRTTVHRVPSRARYDRDTVRAILAEGLVAAVGFVDAGAPFVMPMAYGLLGDDLILHGARASRALKAAFEGGLCVTVTLIDGLVLARSAFHHSMNYRSVVVLGRPRELTASADKNAALAAIVDHVLPGRSSQARPPSDRELAATRVLALSLAEASAKVRTGGPLDDEADLSHPCWAGHLPLALSPAGPPIADSAGHPLPPGLAAYDRSLSFGWPAP